MAQSAIAAMPTSVPHERPFIAADVGGTHARIALMRAGIGGGAATMLHYRQYVCAEHEGLSAIVRDFIDAFDAGGVEHAAIAIAGVLHGDELVNTNLPWQVSLSQMRRALSLSELALINDFEAMARATPYIDPAAATLLTGPALAAPPGPTLVIGPGTGLGAALWMPPASRDAHSTVMATEAGHAALAPGNERELELLRRLLRQWPHVDNERVLSGPGLLNAYRCLCDMEGVAPRWTDPAEIAAAAERGDDAQALEALQIFCAMLGSLVGDLVLTFGAQAVYLAGGIPAHIRPFLQQSGFVERFLNKGVLRSVLASVPVWLIEHGRFGLIGAAAWYMDRRAAE
ncbi:glucokinase [Luteimonas sp. SX5]|uniref:Glucokinase n=1 Tax=Luteimonas galliterrae TaxID=2940486 RepID=A0ABT0MFU0_9GAMM|nr:glucokinase [Luteimonas galliterrae]MCL1633721.1 glucokinase [Luteimonas galliterrae]